MICSIHNGLVRLTLCGLFLVIILFPFQSTAQNQWKDVIPMSIDRCTEQYNHCIESCARYKKQCKARGNTEQYCSGQYTQCANGCRRDMEKCW